MKRTVSLLSAIVIVAIFIASVPITAFARHYNVYYEFSDSGESAYVDYSPSAYGNVTIKEYYEGVPVTGMVRNTFNYSSLVSVIIPGSISIINVSAFKGCKELENVTISEGVQIIGSYAFEECNSLNGVVLPDSIQDIGTWAFSECTSLTAMAIPQGVKIIRKGIFSYCGSLTSVTIPDSVTSIEQMAFYVCANLKSIIIPKSVTTIGESAFDGCGLETVYYTGSEEEWDSIVVSDNNDPLFNNVVFNYKTPDMLSDDVTKDTEDNKENNNQNETKSTEHIQNNETANENITYSASQNSVVGKVVMWVIIADILFFCSIGLLLLLKRKRKNNK